MVRKTCCDPLKKHTKKLTKALIPVPKTFYNYLGLQAGQMICKNCNNKLVALRKQSGSASVGPAEVCSSVEKTDYASSTSNNDTDEDSKEVCLDRLNVTLPLFGITPVKTGKHDKVNFHLL